MKKPIIILLVCLVTFSIPITAYAYSVDVDFYEMFERHGSIMMLIDATTGEIEYANQSAASFYGYSIEELESMNIRELTLASPEEAEKRIAAAVADGKGYYEIEQKLANGEIRTVEVNLCLHTHGKKTLLFLIINDITDKVLLEANQRNTTSGIIIGGGIVIVILLYLLYTLIRNRKKLLISKNNLENFNALRKAFIDADERLIYLKDENLRYVFVNNAFINYHHKKLDEIIGFDDSALTDEEFAKKRRITDLAVLEKQKRIMDEVEWEGRVYKTNKFPIQMLNGKIGVGAYITDITEEREQEIRRRKVMYCHKILADIAVKTFSSKQEQLDYVLHKALRVTESKCGCIYLYDEEQGKFVLNSWARGAMEACPVIQKETIYELENTDIWSEVVSKRKPIIINDFLRPCPLKEEYSKENIQLKRFILVPVIIDGKIVAIIGMGDKEKDYDDNDAYELTLLMSGAWNAIVRRERELELKENKEKLQLILDSAAEGIYGIDRNGNCTFCNISCLKILGYSSPDELIGKNMHYQIHHSRVDGTEISLDECSIYKAFKEGKGTYVEDEVFWRADGTYFEVVTTHIRNSKMGSLSELL